MHLRYLLLCAALAPAGCDQIPSKSKARAVTVAAGVPDGAFFVVSAPTLAELETLADFLEPIDIIAADDAAKPAWLACEPQSCVLSRAASVPDISRHGASWVVPDTAGSLVVWGPADRTALDATVARYREGKAPELAGWKGYVLPAPLLQRWEPSKPRARDLLERVITQSGRIDFTLSVAADRLDASLHMQPKPGEPTLIGDLGLATADLPPSTGMLAPEMLAVARVSASTPQLWKLLRSTLDVTRRTQLDAFQKSLADDLKLDLEADVFASLTGQIALFAYTFEGREEPYTMGDLLTLGATREAILLGVKDHETLRRALDAWTQISQSDAIDGSFQAQGKRGEELEWAWVVDGELRWSAILGPQSLLIVDSTVALDRVRARTSGEDAPRELEDRRATEVIEKSARSGLYLDAARLRAADPQLFGALPERLTSATVTVEPDGASELVRLRLTWDPVSAARE